MAGVGGHGAVRLSFYSGPTVQQHRGNKHAARYEKSLQRTHTDTQVSDNANSSTRSGPLPSTQCMTRQRFYVFTVDRTSEMAFNRRVLTRSSWRIFTFYGSLCSYHYHGKKILIYITLCMIKTKTIITWDQGSRVSTFPQEKKTQILYQVIPARSVRRSPYIRWTCDTEPNGSHDAATVRPLPFW